MKTFQDNSSVLGPIKNWLMLACLLLALPQVYTVKLAGTYLPLAVAPIVLGAPLIRVRKQDGAILLAFVLHYVVAAISIAWSSNVGAWEAYLLFSAIFPTCFFLGRRIRVQKLEAGLKIFGVLSAAHSVLIMAFRLYPEMKLAFLFSGALRIFKNPDRIVGYERGDVALNIFDPLKSGGIFDNANTASTFTLVAIGAVVAVRSSMPKKLFIALMALLVSGVVASGSKSGGFYLVALAALVSFMLAFSSGSMVRRMFVMYLSIIGIVVLSVIWTNLSAAFIGTDIGQDTLKTGGYRVQLWMLAAEVIQQHWLLGVGFGGWADVMAAKASYYGVDPSWPPHNSLLQAWIETGLLGLITLVALWFMLLKRIAKAAMLEVVGAGGALFAFIAAAGMSMGDPTPLLGAPQFAPALAFLIALIMNRRDDQVAK